jgi:DNA recombination protein RmuC
MQAEVSWMVALIALVLGAAMGWLVSALRHRTQIATAVASAQAAKDIELATLHERLRAGEAQLQAAMDRSEQIDAESRRLGQALDEASNEIARLGERASRVSALEGELQSSRQLHQATETSLADLRESTAGELNRLRAELASQADLASRATAERDEARSSLRAAETAVGDLRQDNGRMAAELEASASVTSQLRGERDQLAAELAGARDASNRISQELVDLKARAEKDGESFDSQLQLLLDAKAALTEQFKALASDILEEKSKRFAEQNQTSLTTLLEPLRQKLGEFQGKVEEVYVQEGKDRSALQEQVRNLVTLNQALSEDAKNLTQALKGSSKAQGGWVKSCSSACSSSRGFGRVSSTLRRNRSRGTTDRAQCRMSSSNFRRTGGLLSMPRFPWSRTSDSPLLPTTPSAAPLRDLTSTRYVATFARSPRSAIRTSTASSRRTSSLHSFRSSPRSCSP